MDSMKNINETKIQCIRQYIESEFIDKNLKIEQAKWLSKENNWDGLNSLNMPMYTPCVPDQHNLNDCGYYLLEFIETFLADP
jgi:Ulp1 family protease